MQNDISKVIQEQVSDAYNTASPLVIQANNTKAFYGHTIKGTPLIINQHRGIISYEPTELVITARAGTPLDEIKQALGDQNQQLAFEPPLFSISETESDIQATKTRCATLGGTVACGFSGPARANKGSVRDFVLGCEIINGKAEPLKFGGQVMKNVAGYDVSRLMCGSLGTLGVILNVSLKVLPKPEKEISLCFSLTREDASNKLTQWNAKPYPITASCYYNGTLTLRLAGNAKAVQATKKILGGEELENSQIFWHSIKEQTHEFFNTEKVIWRLSVKPDAILNIDTDKSTGILTEWHGALHWVKTNTPENILRHNIEQHGGHAILYKNGNNSQELFHPLTEPLFRIHRNIKKSFDPENILNRNKMYSF